MGDDRTISVSGLSPDEGSSDAEPADSWPHPSADGQPAAVEGTSGYDVVAAMVFQAAVGGVSADLVGLARRVGQPVDQVGVTVARLCARGLLREVDGVWTAGGAAPVDSDGHTRQDAGRADEWAVLLARRADDRRARLLAAALTTNRHDDDVVLLDPREARAFVTRLVAGARASVLFLFAGPALSDDQDDELLRALRDAAARGVRVASVWAPGRLTVDGGLFADGAVPAWVRQSDDVSTRMIVVDGATVVLPVDPGDLSQGALASRAPGLCSLATALVEHAVRAADAPGLGRQAPRRRSQARAVEVLALLNEGLTEGAVAARLNVNERTVRRILADLREELHVSTSFQLGVAAGHQNLIPHPRPSRPDPPVASPAPRSRRRHQV
jgi:DNA-binding CsgD family transcriptional regulator